MASRSLLVAAIASAIGGGCFYPMASSRSLHRDAYLVDAALLAAGAVGAGLAVANRRLDDDHPTGAAIVGGALMVLAGGPGLLGWIVNATLAAQPEP